MILEPGKHPTALTNHQSISRLPVMGKLLEMCILTKLDNHIKTQNMIPTHQFDFKGKHDATFQLAWVTGYIKMAFVQNQTAVATFDNM